MDRRAFLATVGGGLLAAPLAVEAQSPPPIRRIGVIGGTDPDLVEARKEGLRRLGWLEGQNVVVERLPLGDDSRLAQELARLQIEVIIASTNPYIASAKAATTTIPIVMVYADDPVRQGYVASLARPGGNITGVVTDAGLALEGKGFELLRQAIPTASRIAYLSPRESRMLVPATEAAKKLGVLIIPALVEAPHQEPEYRRAFAAIAQDRADALVVGVGGENASQRRLIIELAAQGRLPAIYPRRAYAEQGGLMSYGPDNSELTRRAAAALARILSGTNPGDIPIYQPTRFEFVINLKTAKALGITVPELLLARADEMIE